MIPVIAIDGPAAAGKGTLARRLAETYGFAYLDTGLLYRATGWKVLSAGGDPENPESALKGAQALAPGDLDNAELRADETASAASKVAAIPSVRAALLDFQRNFAAHPPTGAKGAVIDGRDIGTVVFPATPYKLFIIAALEVRAQRRLKELQERGIESIHARVLQDMKDRDARDSQRDVAPLAKAEDAFQIDTTEMDAESVFSAALSYLVSRSLKLAT